MLSNFVDDNPFQDWETANNDSILAPIVATRLYQGLALLASLIHFIPWIKRAYSKCVEMWKEPLQRLCSLSYQRGFKQQPQQEHDNDQDIPSTSVTWFASDIIFVVLFFPCFLLFPVFVYIGLPALVLYGIPWTLVSSSSSTVDSPLLPLTAWRIMVWIAVWHGLDNVAHYKLEHGNNNKSLRVWHTWGRLGLLMAFWGALCLAAFSSELEHLNQQIQYVGPVRLSHIAIYYRDGNGANNVVKSEATASDGATEYPHVYATWTAEFGSSWACPHMPSDHWCQVRQTACQQTACYKTTCTESEIDFTKAMTRECLNMISLHWMDAAYDSKVPTFDRSVSPRQDGKHWPSMNAYANCETCEIYGATRTGYAPARELLRGLPYAQRLRGYGMSFILAGWLFSAVAGAWAVLFSSRRPGCDAAAPVSTFSTSDFDLGDGDLELEAVLPASAA